MRENSRYDNSYMDDASWNSLLEMAENNEEELKINDKINLYESFLEKDDRYHSSQEVLKALFGYDAFRPGQKAVIDNILSGRDAFVVMPTGGGKSICYQIPAMLLPGITLVISPLISLMQDQVKALNEVGIPATFINSSLSMNTFNETVRKARQGLYKIIYVAPERLVINGFLELARDVQISMITVDEAHCISQWGQDFRPSYMRIVEFVRRLEKRPIISAFTATATEIVREDIVCTLGLINPYVLVAGFDRENLFFQVSKPKKKEQYILDYIADHTGDSGIIYCGTRKNVDSIYGLLKSRGVSVAKYHAGMEATERKKMQDEFVFDYKSIIVATNAFGMGIDKSNVRFVIHYNMPQSMENYYQEAGRAGRDGLDSKGILLFSPHDIIINRYLLEHKEMSDMDSLDRETIKKRDNERLQMMEKYCYTTECLRNYILKYFGENPEKSCEECGNCLHEFDTLDMTDAAKKIINCVYEAKGRYGKSIIIGALCGEKTTRLKEIGAVNYKSYGVLASVNKNLLRRLIEQMIMEGYLAVGEYQVIKLADIRRLKNPQTTILVKITDEDKLPQRETKSKKKLKGKESLTSAGFKLFYRLRELRLEIAREESVPPYIVFNDKTLIDMAVKVPMTQHELLNVSGVGRNKCAKYGSRFIAVVQECVAVQPELIRDKSELVKRNNPESRTIEEKTGKQDFSLLREEAEAFRYSELYNVLEIRDEMNRICNRNEVKRITATRLIDFLTSEGVINEEECEGRFVKVPTDKGAALGIKVIDKVSKKGNAYTILMYPVGIQRMLVERYIVESIIKETPEAGNRVERSWLYQKREQNYGAYVSWTEEEDRKLVEEMKSGELSIRDLSELHGRTTGAIKSRLKKLGLINY